jgi:mannosyltransferase OCH1-like enzyme
MIPKIIWQTYKDSFNSLPEIIKKAAQTWKDFNPEYKYIYMDDEEASAFILHEYGEDWLSIWNSCPIGVMRGDIWRYLVVNKYGGVYADLDTICNQPIESWLKINCDMIVCEDDDGINYAQLAFASCPEHPVLNKVLDYIKKEFENPDYSNKNFVHDMTGVHIWTRAIQDSVSSGVNNIYIYKGKDWELFHNGAITHLGSFKDWHKYGYKMWQKGDI